MQLPSWIPASAGMTYINVNKKQYYNEERCFVKEDYA